MGDEASMRRPMAGDDLLDDVHEVRVVLEADFSFFEHAGALDVDFFGSVDQDVVDRRVLQQRLERAEGEHFVEDGARELLSLLWREWNFDLGDDLLDDGESLPAGWFVVRCRDFFQIEAVQQIAMEADLEFLIGSEIEVRGELVFSERRGWELIWGCHVWTKSSVARILR